MSRFHGKVAFITGATSGIGRATAFAFARQGAAVVVADVAADGNRETARLIEQAGGQALAVTCDVTRADDIRAALDAAVERFGRLDIAFNNAGIEQAIKPAHEITDDEWDRLVAVNLRDDVNDTVDAAFREKYGRYTGYVEPMVAPQARATTLRLVPRSETGA
jgi:NAD(P)-dependent dehydrogenase (short-subunit alcohol dehydrogenase family)